MATVSKQLPEVPFVDLGAEYRALEPDILGAITGVLGRGDFILGREVALFESAFASFCEAKHGIGVDSGLSGLELIIRAYGIGPGDEVITPANTFIASALAISNAGATPILVDVDSETYAMNVSAFEAAITPRTAAVMPVHLYGHPVDMDAILAVARRHNLIVIEDACQAHGARYNGRRVGSLGDAAAFSFYPAKNLGCYGDGGIVVTNDSKVAKYVEMARNYGQREKYYHSIQGFNRRLDTMQAGVLRVKLNHLDERNATRRERAQLYRLCLEGSNVVLPTVKAYAEPVWHLFVVRVNNRDGLRTYLADRGIATGIHYPVPIHLQEAYKGLGHSKGAFPVTEECADQILSLPMFPELTPEMIRRVSQAIREFEGEQRRSS
jgi:dTDP-4-amino-4,6-dideoxygalactose transaminase